MEHYLILNLFLAVTMLSVCYPTEVQGSSDYPTRGYYKYPWRRFNQLKRMETGVGRNEMALDGEAMWEWADKMNDTSNSPIFNHNDAPKDDDAFKSKSASNKKRLNYITPGYGIRVLYGRVPGTVMIWPATL